MARRSGPVRKCYCHHCPNCRSADYYHKKKAAGLEGAEDDPRLMGREPDTGFKGEWLLEEKADRFRELDELISAGRG